MAKYFVTLVLLACVALESTSIHNRIFARSEVSKHPHHHLRHQKHASIETSDHNAHHFKRHHNHHEEDRDDSSLQWDLPPNGSFKPNLWHILHSELSRTNGAEVDSRSDEDDASMLRDGFGFSDDVDNELSFPRHDVEDSKHHKAPPSPSIKCPKCKSDSQNVRVSEEELTQLRIEMVKKQILEKLRLKDKPNVSASGMPKPIYEETTIQQDGGTSSKDLDDYYARTSKKFIFLEREKHECRRLSQPSICFSFKIDDLDTESIDVEQGGHNSKYLPKVKPIAIQSVDVQEGWMKIDIEWPIKRWFGNHDLSHLIHISCESCEIDSADYLVSTEKDYRPFIVIDMQNRRRASRQKRSVNCTDGVTECCREKLYISFDEIGWGDWIIQPRGYDAYFCRGSCSTAASIAQSTTLHTSLMRKVISHRDTTGKKPLELIPCCTANQYSSLKIFYRESNHTATLKNLTNMITESCGCM